MTAEIRRIKEGEDETVAALWDEQARTEPDGARLPPRGRLKIARMLDMAAWHERQLCRVAVDDERASGSCARTSTLVAAGSECDMVCMSLYRNG